MLGRAAALVGSGVQVIALLALNDAGVMSYRASIVRPVEYGRV